MDELVTQDSWDGLSDADQRSVARAIRRELYRTPATYAESEALRTLINAGQPSWSEINRFIMVLQAAGKERMVQNLFDEYVHPETDPGELTETRFHRR